VFGRSVEKKYQEHIKSLQTELERERELYSSQTAKLKHKLQTEIEELRQEEGKLRENLVQAQKVSFQNKYLCMSES